MAADATPTYETVEPKVESVHEEACDTILLHLPGVLPTSQIVFLFCVIVLRVGVAVYAGLEPFTSFPPPKPFYKKKSTFLSMSLCFFIHMHLIKVSLASNCFVTRSVSQFACQGYYSV